MKVCLAPTHLLWNESLGGHAWVFLNWALSLRDAGVKVIVLEKMKYEDDPRMLKERLQRFFSLARSLSLDVEVALLSTEDQRARLKAAGYRGEAAFLAVEDAAEQSDLLLNFRYGLPSEVVARFRRSALVDIDPGLLQCWMSTGHVRPARHHLNFTIGETVGRPEAKFPDGGLRWETIVPPIHLPSWPVVPAERTAPLTTVTNWWGEYEILNGEMVNNEKRTEFLEHLDLPSMVEAPLELAIYDEGGRGEDRDLLRAKGWRTRPAHEVSATPAQYRAYIQESLSEFSCAKRSCMVLANAWISDRTLCYLASGRPAVVQHTGESRLLPDRAGLFRFRSLAEAAECVNLVVRDHAAQGALARQLVEDHFDGQKVVATVLSKTLDAASHGE